MSEYRVCWASSSNISFQGSTDWTEWHEPDDTEDQISAALNVSSGALSDGFEEALNASGFEWWVEVR